MEEPVNDIPSIIHTLTQSTPSTQRATIEAYFTRDASFTHPFCRTGSFAFSPRFNSRELIIAIYRWYKILSPRIDLEVTSVAYDPASYILYVHIAQGFRIRAVPGYRADVELVTVLRLRQEEGENGLRICSQEDLYQTDHFVRFFWLGGWAVVRLWQVLATAVCVLGALVGWPVTLVEERWEVGVSREVEGKKGTVLKHHES
ncbi:hypothetical protein EJ06DRAFT_580641 [Trichodelitschia bisporula]|uniref:SigF-like NTF2-like domain-containing protein n=1 Tax=Trichodelitschia bisporula TaxID=703511 RepID=A0A6G1I2T8_9PEZI|nr:hypothetical protein EJ06DRAFT_580641 [Trichodelitschia bisporula]